MSTRPQRAFELHEQGMSTAEIAEQIDATVHEVNAMLYRVRKQRERKIRADLDLTGAE